MDRKEYNSYAKMLQPVFQYTANQSTKEGARIPSKGRVFVAMSGGVDSSVAALLLKNRDYEVVGIFMRCFNVDGCAERDAEDARRVAEHLEIPFYVWDFEEEYKRKVVDYMIEGYRKGETPNPDVMCNREIKFGLFLTRALEMGGIHVATGHYVRLLPLNLSFGTAVRSLQRLAPAALSSRRLSLRSRPSPSGLRELPQEKLSGPQEEKDVLSETISGRRGRNHRASRETIRVPGSSATRAVVSRRERVDFSSRSGLRKG